MRRATKIGSLMMASVLGFGVALSSASANPRITTAASECQAKTGSQAADLDRTNNGGVQNKNGTNTRDIVCSIPHAPMDPESTRANLFIDGDNTSGGSTVITFSSYSWEGQFQDSETTTTSAASYDEFLTLPSSAVNDFSYLHLLVRLPTNRRGTLRGFSISDSP